jgi:septum formation protein
MRIILASTSRYRRELVKRLVLPIETMASPYDEEADKATFAHLSLDALVVHLAHGKARALARQFPDALVIGCDQMGVHGTQRLGKPHTFEAACAQLEGLQGSTHQLLTAVAVHHGASNREEHLLDVHTLTMRRLTRAQIEHYVRSDEPLDCAGSYRVEALGVALFEAIRGDDFTAVIGLPLTCTVTLLARFGVDCLTSLGYEEHTVRENGR